ncbi:hypothetical protein [Caballeronia sp. LjRoot31]|uniref:hypothetical protein n=1 Tax=Caballeronia sp. LjRoot31 TaxID=3342324 RepID=UPI003ECE68E5
MAYPQTLAAKSGQRGAGHDGSRADIAWWRAAARFLSWRRILRWFDVMPVATCGGLHGIDGDETSEQPG